MDRCNAIIQRMVELMIGYCLNELEIYIASFSDEVGLWNRIPERTQYIIHLRLHDLCVCVIPHLRTNSLSQRVSRTGVLGNRTNIRQ